MAIYNIVETNSNTGAQEIIFQCGESKEYALEMLRDMALCESHNHDKLCSVKSLRDSEIDEGLFKILDEIKFKKLDDLDVVKIDRFGSKIEDIFYHTGWESFDCDGKCYSIKEEEKEEE